MKASKFIRWIAKLKMFEKNEALAFEVLLKLLKSCKTVCMLILYFCILTIFLKFEQFFKIILIWFSPFFRIIFICHFRRFLRCWNDWGFLQKFWIIILHGNTRINHLWRFDDPLEFRRSIFKFENVGFDGFYSKNTISKIFWSLLSKKKILKI